MAVSRGLELQPEYGPKVAVGIPKTIGEKPEEAVGYLRMAGGALLKINDFAAYLSVQIGRQLIEIREDKMWTKIERRDYRDLDHPEGIPQWSKDKREQFFLSFEDFLQNGLPMISGYSGRQGHNFLRLAKSGVVANLSEYDLTQMKSARNVLSLVKIEEARGAQAVTPAMREDAKKLENDKFNRKWEVPRAVVSNTVPEGSDKQFIVAHWLGRMSADMLHAHREIIAEALARCGDSADDVAHLIGSLLAEAWSNDDEHQRQESGPPVQTEADFLNGKTVDVEPEEADEPSPETVSGGEELF